MADSNIKKYSLLNFAAKRSLRWARPKRRGNFTRPMRAATTATASATTTYRICRRRMRKRLHLPKMIRFAFIKNLGIWKTNIWITETSEEQDFTINHKTVIIWIPDKSGCQMVRISNGGVKTGQKMSILCSKMSILWSKMSGIQIVHLITWSDHLKTKQKSVLKVKNVRKIYNNTQSRVAILVAHYL